MSTALLLGAGIVLLDLRAKMNYVATQGAAGQVTGDGWDIISLLPDVNNVGQTGVTLASLFLILVIFSLISLGMFFKNAVNRQKYEKQAGFLTFLTIFLGVVLYSYVYTSQGLGGMIPFIARAPGFVTLAAPDIGKQFRLFQKIAAGIFLLAALGFVIWMINDYYKYNKDETKEEKEARKAQQSLLSKFVWGTTGAAAIIGLLYIVVALYNNYVEKNK